MRAPDRAGFTLMEVVVALTLAAFVLLGARALLGQLSDAAEHIAGTAAHTDRTANAEVLLRALAVRAEAPQPASRSFAGTARGVRFDSWCDVPAGWLERCAVSLGMIAVSGRRVLALELPDEVVAVREGFQEGRILYLRAADDGGRWLDDWSSSTSVPLALGVVMDGDTMILRIGERG